VESERVEESQVAGLASEFDKISALFDEGAGGTGVYALGMVGEKARHVYEGIAGDKSTAGSGRCIGPLEHY